MQNAKDSFYAELRARLAAINPNRTILLRGTTRPGLLVEEAEAPFSQLPKDVFVLRWLGTEVNSDLPAAMIAADCEFIYQTCGSQIFAGLDRGRALSAMDEELVSMTQPLTAAKSNYSVQPPQSLLTNIFWEQPAFGPMTAEHDQLGRSVKVTVYSYQEQGE
ncbi:MAG TPA: hypothetical protein VHZ28_01755 [Terracidiphilus sp.]|jgi:hypothetical protein|nr:hypothetical protein [Terracidiphilus sp.]